MSAFRRNTEELLGVIRAILNDENLKGGLDLLAERALQAYQGGNKLLIAGNGGSAAEAQHMAAEIVCRFRRERKARPALALTVDTSVLTAWGNDRSFDAIFARQIEAFGNEGDMLLLLSTSGDSRNLIEAAKTARGRGIIVAALLGKGGGKLLELCDHAVVIPSESTPRIQECHLLIIHILCEALDTFFAGEDEENRG